MARVKQFLEINVVEAAKQRVSHIFDIFDTVVVQFSGGKDSLVCLHLCLEEADRRGQLPLDVIFRDEELIPDSVVNFVNEYRQRSDMRMRWYCVPSESEKFILGKRFDYVQWDLSGSRPFVREKPEWGLAGKPGIVYNQLLMDEYMSEGYRGKVAFVTGIRASESLVRFRSVVNKLNENYIVGSKSSDKVKLAKPIYDWSENDVMKWLHESGIAWCPIYDVQHITGAALRVATPLHAEAAKRLGVWKAQDGDFYDRVMQAFPEMYVQERYYADLDVKGELAKYHETWMGCKQYIDENIADPETRRVALTRLVECRLWAKTMGAHKYNPKYLLHVLATGAIKRRLLGAQVKA